MVNGKSKVKLHNYFLVKPLRLITAPSHTAPCQDLHFLLEERPLFPSPNPQIQVLSWKHQVHFTEFHGITLKMQIYAYNIHTSF